MTVARPDRPPTPLETAKQQVEHALGQRTARRLDTFDDGTLYVSAGSLARLLSWFVDFLVFALVACGGFVALMMVKPEISDGDAALVLLGLLFGVPILYGLFFVTGRALGGLFTGTRLVRVKNGGRIAWGACWAMLVRTVLFPLLLVIVVTSGSVASGSLTRISIDDAETRRLRAAGFVRPGH
jgi:hypothetical protein